MLNEIWVYTRVSQLGAILLSSGHVTMSRDIFDCLNWGRENYWNLVLETRDADKPLKKASDGPHNKDFFALKSP